MTAEGAKKIAVAPLAAGLATKLTTPPSTGSTGLLAVTVTASGLANAVPMFAVCGVLPATSVRVKPWLSKAPMSTPPTRRDAALVGGGDAAGAGAGVDGRAAGQQGHGLGRPAVVAQRGEQRVGRADDVAGDVVAEPARAAGADQVVAPETRSSDVSRRRSTVIAGDDRVGQRGRAVVVVQAAAVALAELPLTVQLVSVVVPPPLSRPPP